MKFTQAYWYHLRMNEEQFEDLCNRLAKDKKLTQDERKNFVSEMKTALPVAVKDVVSTCGLRKETLVKKCGSIPHASDLDGCVAWLKRTARHGIYARVAKNQGSSLSRKELKILCETRGILAEELSRRTGKKITVCISALDGDGDNLRTPFVISDLSRIVLGI